MIKLLSVVGPTATGKTALGLKLARKFNADLISADSRQVYDKLDIVTGKDIPPGFTKQIQARLSVYTDGSIRLFGLDQVTTAQDWNAFLFRRFATQAIKDINRRGRLPILIGGTGLYIKTLLENLSPPAPPNPRLRQKLEKQSILDLQHQLEELDPDRFQNLNLSDRVNPRRLVRAIEIATHLKTKSPRPPLDSHFDSLVICLTAPAAVLRRRINNRVTSRLKADPRSELEYLKTVDPKLQSKAATALGYHQLNQYYSGEITKPELIDLWTAAEYQYSRRQLTWFKKQAQIHYFDITQADHSQQVVDLVSTWYSGTNGPQGKKTSHQN